MLASSSVPSLTWFAWLKTGTKVRAGGLSSARACAGSSSLTTAGRHQCQVLTGAGRTMKDFFVRVFLAKGSRCPWEETQVGDHPW